MNAPDAHYEIHLQSTIFITFTRELGFFHPTPGTHKFLENWLHSSISPKQVGENTLEFKVKGTTIAGQMKPPAVTTGKIKFDKPAPALESPKTENGSENCNRSGKSGSCSVSDLIGEFSIAPRSVVTDSGCSRPTPGLFFEDLEIRKYIENVDEIRVPRPRGAPGHRKS